MFTVKINSSNHRVNTGAVEQAIKATFAEVLSENVEVFVNQSDDHTLCITVEREEDNGGETRAELEARVREMCIAEAVARESDLLDPPDMDEVDEEAIVDCPDYIGWNKGSIYHD